MISNPNRTAVFGNSAISGGGEQSAQQIAKLLGADFLSLTANDDWKSSQHKKQIFYMNDKVYAFKDPNQLKDDFIKVISRAQEIYIVLNFTLGGFYDLKWLKYYPIKKVLFLNETKRLEWSKKVCSDLAHIPTKSLAPCVAIDKLLKVKRTPSESVRIARHSRISLKYPIPPASPCDIYDELLKTNDKNIEFKFMLAHKAIIAKYGNHPQFKIYSWNEVPLAEYLAGTDIFLYLISQKCNDQGPRVIVEAMAAGVPCIAENRDGMKDRIVHGENGFLIENMKEAVKMTNVLIRDKLLREVMGENAREHARKHFQPTNWAEELKIN